MHEFIHSKMKKIKNPAWDANYGPSNRTHSTTQTTTCQTSLFLQYLYYPYCMILVIEKMTLQNKLYEIKLVPYNKTLYSVSLYCVSFSCTLLIAIGKLLGVPCAKKEEEQINGVLFIT